jgi:hypothetical protein
MDARGVDIPNFMKTAPRLSYGSINIIRDQIARRFDIDASLIGYDQGPRSVDFSYKGNILATVSYNWDKRCYGSLEIKPINRELVQRVDQLEVQNRKTRKLALKREESVRKWKKIGIGGIAALVLLGAMAMPPHFAEWVNAENQTAIVEEVGPVMGIQSIESIPNVALEDWTNYAISEISKSSKDSEWDEVKTMGNNIVSYYGIPVLSSYYNMLDYQDQLAYYPAEIIGSNPDNLSRNFRNAAYSFNEQIEGSIFSQYTFEKSPYVTAIVADKDGNVAQRGEVAGEVVDANGDVITEVGDDQEYDVYLNAAALDADIDINYLPAEESIIVTRDGVSQVYVTTDVAYNILNNDGEYVVENENSK